MATSPHSADVVAETFDTDVLQRSHQVPVLVDFWAAWCGPCRSLMPVLARLADEYAGKFFLAKVNSDEQQQLANQFGVRSLPTVKLFRNGQVVDEFMGVQPEPAIRTLLDRHIPRESDALIRQAVEVAQRGEFDQALAIMQDALLRDPTSDRVKLELTRFLAHLKRVDEAEKVMETASPEARNSDQAASLRAQFEFLRMLSNARPPDVLAEVVAANPADSAACYELALHRIVAHDYQSALTLLLDIVRRDRKWNDDAARKAMVSVFNLLGNNELVATFRRQLSLAIN